MLQAWMIYSLVREKLYCCCCRFFAVNDTDKSKFVTMFQMLWKLSSKVKNHETSEEHLPFRENWKTLAAGLR